jgi:hypothetical protein
LDDDCRKIGSGVIDRVRRIEVYRAGEIANHINAAFQPSFTKRKYYFE